MNDVVAFLYWVGGPIAVTVLLASAAIFLVLHKSRRPRFFILWIIGLHALVMSFLGLILVWNAWHFETVAQSAAQRELRFTTTLGTCAGSGILIEGALLFLVCRIRSGPDTTSVAPSITRSIFAALIGNALSLGSLLAFGRGINM